MSNAERAEIVARIAFAKDWNALAHTIKVVENMRRMTDGDDDLAVAWLHDVVEDSDVDYVDLQDVGFPEHVVDAVRLLSRTYGSDYDSYKLTLLTTRGEAGTLARRTKLADARQNLDRCRAAVGIPKWERLATTRYYPLVQALEAQMTAWGEL